MIIFYVEWKFRGTVYRKLFDDVAAAHSWIETNAELTYPRVPFAITSRWVPNTTELIAFLSEATV